MSNRNAEGQFVPGHTVPAYTDEEMLEFFELYLKHRAGGKDKESFGKIGCSHRTIDAWLRKNETIFPALRAHMDVAEAKGWNLWESLMFNVGFGIPTKIPMPTPDDPNATFQIEPKYTQPHILIFMMKSKFRSVYGDKLDNTVQSNLNLTGSTITYVIDPDTGEPMRFNFSQNPATHKIIDSVNTDEEDFQAALTEINKPTGG